MDVCIDKNFLGTPRSLVVKTDGSFRWASASQSGITLGKSAQHGVDLNDMAAILGIESVCSDEWLKVHRNTFKQLGTTVVDVPWHAVLGKTRFKQHVQKIVKKSRHILSRFDETGYFETYRAGVELLACLQPTSIDSEKLEQYIQDNESGPSVEGTLKGFRPAANGSCWPTVYTTAKTTTGRLVVKGGPSILTLPAANRDIIRTSYNKGKIYQIDFVSLEPKVMLCASGRTPPNDVYNDLMYVIPELGSARQAAKVATLSALYGSSPRALASLLGGDYKLAKAAIEGVHKYFGTTDLADRLQVEYGKECKVDNYYGRPLWFEDPRPSILVNHYVQSTAVDTSLLGFRQIISSLAGLGVVPHFVIHDALVVDVPDEHEGEFIERCNQGVRLPIGEFSLKLSIISQSRQ